MIQHSTKWILWGVGCILLILVICLLCNNVEPFADVPTLLSQRQALQFEGERRFNDLARLESPTVIGLSDSLVEQAIQQVVPVPTSNTFSLLSLLGYKSYVTQDDGSNKTGAGVEQTGMVQEKINFCESLPVNCSTLDDPRAAECGMCHRDGIDSTGKAHRGGMYISSDDQIRANELATANNVPAIYNPTIGTCKPQNFTLMSESCQVRELSLQCQSAGAATFANQCGQCYGASTQGSTGLLYVGPKGTQTAPTRYVAYLHVTHPGGHTNNGYGITVTYSNGSIIGLPPSTTNGSSAFNHQVLPITIQEGDTFTITVYGVPSVWAGWISNQSGTRVVSLDIGVQSITPTTGFAIAGDKRSNTVLSGIGAGVGAGVDLSIVPSTVLWWSRRDEVLPGMITNAWYGIVPNDPTQQGVDVTGYVKMAAGASQQFTVDPSVMSIQDPFPNAIKHLWITHDNGSQVIVPDGAVVLGTTLVDNLAISFTVPASVQDPLFADDLADCPTGPIVTTEIGAGLMGSHSCFKADGTFNPSQYCLQELFQSAGGTQQGSAFPNTDAKVAALVVNDSTSGNPSLDATMANLNLQGTIATYGTDMAGTAVPFPVYVAAAQAFLGFTPTNPCAGAQSATGPHTSECLDYLWRTSASTQYDGTSVDPTTLPYASCGAAGIAAPLNPDGSPNTANIGIANGYGSMSNVRSYYQSIFNQSQNTSDFDAQAAAMRNCFNINIPIPPTNPGDCPPPNPTDWRCMGPTQLRGPEVYFISTEVPYVDSTGVCETYDGRLATLAELTVALQNGADWCGGGWTAGDSTTGYYPITTSIEQGCGNGSAGMKIYNTGTIGGVIYNYVNCFGVKPPPGTANIGSFNATMWYTPTPLFPAGNEIITYITSEVNGTVLCASTDGQTCTSFPDNNTCQQTLNTINTNNTVLTGIQPNNNLSAAIDQYLRSRM